MSPESPADLVFGDGRVVFAGGASDLVAVTHDEEADRLVIANDRYGHDQVFLARRPGSLVLATRLDTLLAHGLGERKIDRTALAEVLAFGVPLERRTLVPGIETLPPATRLSVDLETGATSEERTWSAAAALAGPQRPYATQREALIEAFLAGFDRAADGGPVAVTLSGGMDSRCLLAAALHRRMKTVAVNCSVPGSRSASYAAKMAARTGTPYFAHPVGEAFAAEYGQHLRGVVELTEGMTFSSEVECHFLRERVSGARVVLHGAFGELTKLEDMHLYYVDAATAAAGRAALPDLLWRRIEPGLARALLVYPRELQAELRERARASLDARVAKVDPGLGSVEALQVLYIEELLGKVTKESALIWNDRVPTRFPFAYAPFVDLVLATRSEDRMVQRFQMDFLRRTARSLFQFPDANSGLRVDAPEVLRSAVKLADRARRVLTLGRRAQDHADPRTWIAGMQPGPETILDGAGPFDRGEVERLLELLRAGAPLNPVALVRQRIAQHAAAAAIERAMILRLWMERTGLGL